MNGHVKNRSGRPLYALKRHILPGKEVPLAELYKEYGEKHDIDRGQPFVDWLRQVKLPNEQIWEIQYMDSPMEENKVTVTAQIMQVVDGDEKESEEKKEGLSNEEKAKSARPHVKKEWEVEDVVSLTVSKAREEIPKIRDKKLLSWALNVARQRPNKETVCRILEKRIDELRVSMR
jgi:hypothetical protein